MKSIAHLMKGAGEKRFFIVFRFIRNGSLSLLKCLAFAM
jgi:hypothetical protein